MISIPRIWEGGTAFLIGGGPSLREMDLTTLHKQRVIGCNNAFELGDWVDICLSVDGRWLDWNWPALREFPGLKLTCCERQKVPAGVQLVRRGRKMQGFETDPRVLCWNKSTGGCAVNLALHLGVKRAVLVGYDMQVGPGGENNWHTRHKHNPRKTVYATRFMPAFEELAKEAPTLGLEILNATPGSALKCFPFVKLEDVC